MQIFVYHRISQFSQSLSAKRRLFIFKLELANLVRKSIYGEKIVIGMGAGSISSWMKQLPKLI